MNYIFWFNKFEIFIQKKIIKDFQLKNMIEKNLARYLINFTNYLYKYFYKLLKLIISCFKAYLNIIDKVINRAAVFTKMRSAS